jgi:hypothetical protein
MGGRYKHLRMKPACALLGTALVVLAVACSDGKTTAPASTAAPSTAIPVTTAPATTPSTTAAPTTAPATTTTVPAEERLRQDFAAYKQSWRTCLSQLPNCDTTQLEATRVDPQLAFSNKLATDWNANGYQARNIERLTAKILGASIDPGGTTGTVVDCENDGVVIVKPSGVDGGADQVINDEFVTSQVSWQVVLGPDGHWRAKQSTVIQSAVGEDKAVCVTSD